jgi:UDP-N-acetyl-D-galactosamine dehydrogenase
VGEVLKKGDIVAYESTVYPGATEEDCIPVLEQASSPTAGVDFTVGYSPQRINPGDTSHRFETIKKIVAGQDERENAQRDLNIAFINELSAIFHKLGIDTLDVLAGPLPSGTSSISHPVWSAATASAFDPYYLTHRAQKAGYHPDVILAGRRINDTVGVRIARECLRHLLRAGVQVERVTLLGLTFKENVVNIRNSRVIILFESFNRSA